jgi:hypothetical protein
MKQGRGGDSPLTFATQPQIPNLYHTTPNFPYYAYCEALGAAPVLYA